MCYNAHIYYSSPHLFLSFFFNYRLLYIFFFFFFNDTATTEIYTLSLHDALPISGRCTSTTTSRAITYPTCIPSCIRCTTTREDRKSTRLNSSHVRISYAVFCLKKKKKTNELVM